VDSGLFAGAWNNNGQNVFRMRVSEERETREVWLVGIAMAPYRMYCLDREGRIGFAQWIEADSDDHAIAEAHRLNPGARRCEVWRGNCLVAQLNAENLAVAVT
jgi:hypothetical protein